MPLKERSDLFWIKPKSKNHLKKTFPFLISLLKSSWQDGKERRSGSPSLLSLQSSFSLLQTLHGSCNFKRGLYRNKVRPRRNRPESSFLLNQNHFSDREKDLIIIEVFGSMVKRFQDNHGDFFFCKHFYFSFQKNGILRSS